MTHGDQMEGLMGLEMKYFVLKPSGSGPYAYASRMAMVAYAAVISEQNPEMARELLAWVGELQIAFCKDSENDHSESGCGPAYHCQECD